MLYKYVNKVQLNEHVAQSIKNNILASTHHVQAIYRVGQKELDCYS